MRNPKAMLVALAAALITLATPAAAQFREIEQPTGDWTHAPTGTVFPATVGDFERMPIKLSAAAEMWSIAYTPKSDELMTLNLYLYPTRGMRCDDEYARQKSQTEAKSNAARLIFDRPAASPSGRKPGVARSMRHQLPEGTIPGMGALTTEGYLFCSGDGNWFVSYRATWVGDADYDARITALFHAIRWPAPLAE